MRRPPTPRRGDPITWEHVAYLYQLAERGLSVVPPLALHDDGSIYLAEVSGFWARITGAPGGTSGKAYPWQEVQAAPSGGWINRVNKGTTTSDPAFELNGGTAAITNTVVWAGRDVATAEVRFLYGAC